jgi:hypothetical protein
MKCTCLIITKLLVWYLLPLIWNNIMKQHNKHKNCKQCPNFSTDHQKFSRRPSVGDRLSRPVVLRLFGFAAHCKTYIHFLAYFVYTIKNILIYFKLWIKISIQVGFLSFLKYIFIIFAAHLATSCGAPFENHWSRHWKDSKIAHQPQTILVNKCW